MLAEVAVIYNHRGKEFFSQSEGEAFLISNYSHEEGEKKGLISVSSVEKISVNSVVKENT